DVVDNGAALGRGRRHGDGIEPLELEHVAREDAVWVAYQRLDFGHAERARETGGLDLRGGAAKRLRERRLVEEARQPAIVLSRRDGLAPGGLAAQGPQPLQKARRHHGRAVA